jgi:hypothetical protein
MTHGAGFRIAGRVKRKFVATSGKVAFLTLEIDFDGKHKSIDLKAFGDQVVEVGSLREHDDVEVTGSVDAEQPKNKDKSAVQKDGRDFWCPSLTIKVVKAAKREKPPEPTDDELGF